VALIIFNTDGRGFEEVFRVVGGGSKWGTVKTREASGTWVKTGIVQYAGNRRDLPMGHPLRDIGKIPVMYDGFLLSFEGPERRRPQVLNTNEDMLEDAVRIERLGSERNPKLHDHGVKGRHSFCDLPYIKKTLFAYDYMHVLGNIVKVCMRLFRRKKTHRSMGAAVLRFDQERTGKYLDRNPGQYPDWVFTQAEMNLCDQRLARVRSNDNCDVPKNIFKHLGNQNTHQLMIFAFVYAPHCLGELSGLPTY
jgi:hypothetical protein